MDAGGVATFGHFRSAERHQGITGRPAGGREMSLRLETQDTAVTNPMNASDRTYAAEQFATQQGERWRRFLERVGTRSNDFAARLSRARFVYLHRRETATHWLPL
jgi:hypothetical protein